MNRGRSVQYSSMLHITKVYKRGEKMIWKKCLALILGITLLLLPLLFCQGVASSRAGIDILGFSTNSIFYNSSEVGSFQYSLWNDVSPPIYADITIYGEFHGNGTKYILDRRYNVYI